jgi:glycosyltransferase involved in cell wall biosynthesis
MAASDCGIFPARAEGWNLELLEMMSCGKTVIATNYSAHTEFCTKDNSKLIEITDLETAHDNPYFNGQGKWAHFGEPQMKQLCEHMREAYEQKQVINLEGIKTAKAFSWANSATRLMDVV